MTTSLNPIFVPYLKIMETLYIWHCKQKIEQVLDQVRSLFALEYCPVHWEFELLSGKFNFGD